jgi:hypothetical protein
VNANLPASCRTITLIASVVKFDLVTMLLGTEPPADRNIKFSGRNTSSSGSAGIFWTRDLPDVTLEGQAGSLLYKDTEGQTESLSDEDTGGQAQGSTDEDLESTQSSLDDILGGPDGSDSNEDLKDLFALNSSDEALNKGRDEALELDYEAFRTITTLLALTQTWPDLRRSNKDGPKPESTREERLVLKICNSLAVLAVIQHEVIAIGVDYQPTSVNVIISASLPEQESSLTNFTKLDLLVNKNPRHSEYKQLNDLTEDELTIKPRMPTGLKEFALREFAVTELTEENLTSDVLRHYITSLNVTRLVPLVLSHVLFLHGKNRDNPTLEEHIWMLLRIFNTWKTWNDLNPLLMPYVTMTCFPKMLGRINHPRSQLYLKVFCDVHLDGISFSRFKEPTATVLETQNDQAFLVLFMNTHGKWPQGQFPCLHKLATSEPEIGRSFQLYNEATCREFHVVVQSIIHSFQDELLWLNSYREKLRGNNRGDNTPILDKSKITELPLRVNWYGHLLRRLCAGAALRTHLENINESLANLLQPAPKRRRSFKAGSDGGGELNVVAYDPDADADAEDSEVDEGNFEVDEESMESAAEHHDQVPWVICLRWLKLLIAQFDAANNLVARIAVPNFPTISAKILRNTSGARSLMPWKDLLNNPNYFPTKSVVAGRDRDNANIISSLERAISGRPYELGSQLEEIQNYWQKKIKTQQTKHQKKDIARYLNVKLCEVEKSLVPGCQATAGDIKRNIEKWLESDSASNANSSLSVSAVVAGQINDQIDSMLDMCYIFSQFDNPTHFSGTVHCEATLANYLTHFSSLPGDEKLDQVEVGYLVLS